MSFRCSPDLKNRIDALVRAGLYSDFSSFCATAVEDQLLLEAEHVPEQKFVSGPTVSKRGRPEMHGGANALDAFKSAPQAQAPDGASENVAAATEMSPLLKKGS